jgi:hypothetical protein
MNLFAGLAEYFIEQFVRSAVRKSVVVAVEKFHAVSPVGFLPARRFLGMRS